jgi:hypothetical protein
LTSRFNEQFLDEVGPSELLRSRAASTGCQRECRFWTTDVTVPGNNEIDAALAKYGLGSDRRMCKAIHFFEGELRLIAECLRCAGPQKVAKQPPGSTHGVATREEIEKYLKQLKRMQTAA